MPVIVKKTVRIFDEFAKIISQSRTARARENIEKDPSNPESIVTEPGIGYIFPMQ